MKVFFMMIFGVTFIILDVAGQKKVDNSSFNALLKVMLKHNVKEITIPAAAIKKNVIFLDAREKKEYAVSHIKNAVFVGYNDFNLSRLENISKESEIIVYCSIGKRSEAIAQKLSKIGYGNVSNLYGGIFEWVNQGNSVVDINSNPTNNVHAFGRFWGQWLNKGEKVYD